MTIEDYVDANLPIPLDADSIDTGNLFLSLYTHKLPNWLKNVNGYLHLDDYMYPLPKGLTSCHGYISLVNYEHPLPQSFSECGKFYLSDTYSHPLPESFIQCDDLILYDCYQFPLPSRMQYNTLSLGDYLFPLNDCKVKIEWKELPIIV